RRHDRGGERTFTAPTCRAKCLGAQYPPLGETGQQFDHLLIELRGGGINRLSAKQGGIERVRVGHGSPPARTFSNAFQSKATPWPGVSGARATPSRMTIGRSI